MESSVPNESKAMTPRQVSTARRWFLPAIEFVQFYGAFFLFGGGGILFTIVSAILYPILPRKFGTRFGRTMMSRLFRFYLWMTTNLGTFEVDLSELDALRDERGLVIAANHPGLLDAVLLISRLPNVTCIMKAEIWDNIFLGGGSRLAGYIRNDDQVNMVRLAAAELKRGQQLLVFPEGTRTRKKPVNSFKGGFALIAKRAGAPIQTVIIETDNPCLSKGWPLFKKPVLPVVFKVRLGERFDVPDDVHAFVAKLEDYFHRALPAVK